MPVDDSRDKTEEFERLLIERENACFQLRLYVTGLTPRSIEAIDNIKTICEEQLKGRYSLEVIDISQHPEMAREAQIIAAPTLVKVLPLPLRQFIGDLSDRDRVLVGLDLKEKREGS